MTVRHDDPRDIPNIGREHPASAEYYLRCGLCRCGAHNVEDDPHACMDCWDQIADTPNPYRRLIPDAYAD